MVKSSSLCIEGISGVGIQQELREENIKDVDQVKHGGPGLVDYVETHTARTIEYFVIECAYE
jgi:hypothetical protein